MTARPEGHLGDLARVRDARSARASSWDRTGGNVDSWVIGPGESVTLADLEGPGCLTHIWMTQSCYRSAATAESPQATWDVVDPDYYRKVLLKIYWDDQEQPSVLVPLGDFFGLMNSLAAGYSSMPVSVSVKAADRLTFGGNAAFSSYFPMPFGTRARVVVENQNDVEYLQYFYIDYELYRVPLAPDAGYFHAQWRRQESCDGWGPDLQVNGPEVEAVSNLDGRGNYVILEAEGQGQYVGCNLAVRHYQGSWWGEGDDMIFVDDDTWPPSLHGTGGEDYLGHAWGMHSTSFPMSGTIVHEDDMPGFQHSYRFHVTDPVRFSTRIRVTMEHGHANHLADDWASTAYWYQRLPTSPFGILPVEQRLPPRPPDLPRPAPSPPWQDDMTAARAAGRSRSAELHRERQGTVHDKVARTRAASAENIVQARDVRRRWLEG